MGGVEEVEASAVPDASTRSRASRIGRVVLASAAAILMGGYAALFWTAQYDWGVRVLGAIVIGCFFQGAFMIGVLVAERLSGLRGAIWDTNFSKLRAGALFASMLWIGLAYLQRQREQVFVDCLLNGSAKVDFGAGNVPSLVSHCRPLQPGQARMQD